MSMSLKFPQHHFSPNRARSREKRPPYLPYKRRSRFHPYLETTPKTAFVPGPPAWLRTGGLSHDA